MTGQIHTTKILTAYREAGRKEEPQKEAQHIEAIVCIENYFCLTQRQARYPFQREEPPFENYLTLPAL